MDNQAERQRVPKDGAKHSYSAARGPVSERRRNSLPLERGWQRQRQKHS
jgi:hypothetical protein